MDRDFQENENINDNITHRIGATLKKCRDLPLESFLIKSYHRNSKVSFT